MAQSTCGGQRPFGGICSPSPLCDLGVQPSGQVPQQTASPAPYPPLYTQFPLRGRDGEVWLLITKQRLTGVLSGHEERQWEATLWALSPQVWNTRV